MIKRTTRASDYNEPGYTPQHLSGSVYQDLNPTLIHPISKRCLVYTDIDAVRGAINTILMTPKGSRPFNPQFGTSLSTLLFEVVGQVAAGNIQREITRAISKYEPRIHNALVLVTSDLDNNRYNIDIQFTVGEDQRASHSFILNQVR